MCGFENQEASNQLLSRLDGPVTRPRRAGGINSWKLVPGGLPEHWKLVPGGLGPPERELSS